MAKTCVICQCDIGVFTSKTAISDGFVCGSCLKDAGITILDNSKSYATNSLKELLRSRKQIVNEFLPSKKVNILSVDQDHKLFKIGNDLFKFNNLLTFELLEDGHTVTKGGLGRAVAGGLLFGGLGAVVGGVTGKKKSKGVCNSMKLRVTLKNAHRDTAYLTFISSETKMSSILYRSAQDEAQSCIAAMQLIIDSNNMDRSEIGVSVADEILKLKSLLDQGIISEEEFEQQKKRLLANG